MASHSLTARDVEIFLGSRGADSCADSCRRHYGALRRRRRRLLWHTYGEVAALLRYSDLARATRNLLDRNRVACGGSVHRTSCERQGAQRTTPGCECTVSSAARCGGGIDVR